MTNISDVISDSEDTVALYHSTLYVHGPKIHGKTCQQAIDAVFFPYLLNRGHFDEERQPLRASDPAGAIASVRIVTNDPPVERLVQELSGKLPEFRFALVKNDVHGAETQTAEYQAGRATSPIAVEPDHRSDPSVGGRDATTTLPANSAERGPGTAGLLSVAVQHLHREYQLSQHVFVWQGQYGSSEFSRMTALAGKHCECYETISDLLSDDDRVQFAQLMADYEKRASAFTTKRQAADDLHESLTCLREPWLVESLDHEGRESVSKATEALQSALNTLHIALRDLDLNRRAD